MQNRRKATNAHTLESAVKMVSLTLRKVVAVKEIKAYQPDATTASQYREDTAVQTLGKLRTELKI